MVFWIGKFTRGVMKQIGALGRAKKQEWDENSIRVIHIDKEGRLDDRGTGELTPAGFVLLHYCQKVVEIRKKYRDLSGRPTVIYSEGSYKTEDVDETFNIHEVHKGEPVYPDMRSYEEVQVRSKHTGPDGKEVTTTGTALQPEAGGIRLFTQAEVSSMVYRVLAARVNNMFQEPSFNFTILMSAAAGAGGLVMGLILSALFLS